jgi:DNA-binding GntR family transcriptional regulator
MSTIPDPVRAPSSARPLRVRSVVGLAYDEIRSLIVSGALAPGSRLGQGELADRLGISRGSVREALRRLAGDGLVMFEVNRGFFVAEAGLDDVRHRLEARLVLEPGIARLAAERRTDADLDAMRETITVEVAARTSDEVHDASRAFHFAVAAATGNTEFTKLLDGLWIADVGRQLLAQRRQAEDWQDHDVEEHRAIVEALAVGDGERAAELMGAHVESAVRHWSPRSETPERD